MEPRVGDGDECAAVPDRMPSVIFNAIEFPSDNRTTRLNIVSAGQGPAEGESCRRQGWVMGKSFLVLGRSNLGVNALVIPNGMTKVSVQTRSPNGGQPPGQAAIAAGARTKPL